jgi:hypothetical protein
MVLRRAIRGDPRTGKRYWRFPGSRDPADDVGATDQCHNLTTIFPDGRIRSVRDLPLVRRYSDQCFPRIAAGIGFKCPTCGAQYDDEERIRRCVLASGLVFEEPGILVCYPCASSKFQDVASGLRRIRWFSRCTLSTERIIEWMAWGASSSPLLAEIHDRVVDLSRQKEAGSWTKLDADLLRTEIDLLLVEIEDMGNYLTRNILKRPLPKAALAAVSASTTEKEERR